ncbi:uncharacterized protein LOC6531708 isoform X1 [Drosophila yakuba]|uniref:Uncharacterized protein n=2 Tax=Drosophila yakuba TaxID=7245 RepID=B4P8J4_DROYA|nr:uncharacterized protein LOC6531708 isoform X1 [Drosophila yakuba]EDW92211.2 uncharacterized protein Dyak_GE14228 [Drosophila yakuba]
MTMTRTKIATPRCETIAKLVVSIGSGESFLTYADATTRSFCANPSWLNFQNGMMEVGPISKPNPHDSQKEAASFLERHFGIRFLDSKPLNESGSAVDFQERKTIIWHTWLVEKVRIPPAQCAVIKDWKDPCTETLGTCSCSWHLQNCMAWQLIISNRMTDAKCFCSRIKKTMDIVNCLVDPELEQDNSLKDCSTPLAALTEKVFGATDQLKKLIDLLELQEKRNRRYKRLYE